MKMKKKSATVILLSSPSHYLLKLKSSLCTDLKTCLYFPPIRSLLLSRNSHSDMWLMCFLVIISGQLDNFQCSPSYSTS